MLPWAGQTMHPFEIYAARAGYNSIGHIFVRPPQWGYVSVCEIVGRPSCISLSLYLSLALPFVDGRVWSPWRVSFVGLHSTF